MGVIEKAKIGLGKASDWMNGLKDKFTSSINKVQGYLGSAFEVAKNGSTFTGINYDSIDKIRGSIRTYVTKIQNELANINSDLSPDKALKGEVAAAAKAYVKAVTEVADAYVSSLLAYSDMMYKYGVAFKDNEQKLAQNVNEEATALASSAEKYTEKY